MRDCRLPIDDCRLSGGERGGKDCRLMIADCGLGDGERGGKDCRLPIADCRLSVKLGTGNRLAVSERMLEAMYAEFIAKAGRGESTTFLEYKKRFMRATGFFVGDVVEELEVA